MVKQFSRSLIFAGNTAPSTSRGPAGGATTGGGGGGGAAAGMGGGSREANHQAQLTQGDLMVAGVGKMVVL